MSHFVGIVIVKEKNTNVKGQVERILKPFCENIKVKRYQKTCQCSEWAALSKARKECIAKFGSIDDLRESFQKKIKADSVLSKEKFGSEKIDAAWEEHMKGWNTLENERKAHWLTTVKPDKKCSDCKGKGWYWSQYNPDSKWDWYVVGGRWTGFLAPEYDPYTDPENLETCSLCAGTGVRPDMPVFADGASPFESKPVRTEAAKCNGCEGKGTSVKFSLRPFDGDTKPVSEWIALMDAQAGKDEKDEKYVPYCVVTPDKKWHQRGDMGWFGMSSNEKDKDNWIRQVREAVDAYKDGYLAVVVDFHI